MKRIVLPLCVLSSHCATFQSPTLLKGRLEQSCSMIRFEDNSKSRHWSCTETSGNKRALNQEEMKALGLQNEPAPLSEGRQPSIGLYSEELGFVLKRNDKEIDKCFSSIHNFSTRQGEVVIEMTIAPSGKVEQERIAATADGFESMHPCLLKVASSLRFPAPRGGVSIRLKYPIKMTYSNYR